MIALAAAAVSRESQQEASEVDITPEEHRYHHYSRYGHHYGHGGRYYGHYRGRRSIEEDAPVEDLEAEEHRFGGYRGHGYGGRGYGGYYRGHHYG